MQISRGDAEMQPSVDALVRHAQLGAGPHDFLDVGRIFAAPEFQHDVFLSTQTSCVVLR